MGSKEIQSLEVTRASTQSVIESVRILIQEKLFDEAKSLLRKEWLRPNLSNAERESVKLFLQNISDQELKMPIQLKSEKVDSPEKNSAYDLEGAWEAMKGPVFLESSSSEPRELLDLCMAYISMDFFEDAHREAHKALSIVRQEQTDLGETGLALSMIIIECLFNLGRFLECQVKIEELNADMEINLADRAGLFYWMGRVKQENQLKSEALSWFQSCHQIDPFYRDVLIRINEVQR